MPYKSFILPVQINEWAERELNTFVANHRVLSVDRRWVDEGRNSYWAILVDYLDSPEPGREKAEGRKAKPRIDYREILSPEDFEVFARLRTLRKEIADEEGVQLYAIFTNEQLAQAVQRRVATKEQLQNIPGIGEMRVQKYGDRILHVLKDAWKSKSETSNGTVSENSRS